jgi:hypothetical protein
MLRIDPALAVHIKSNGSVSVMDEYEGSFRLAPITLAAAVRSEKQPQNAIPQEFFSKIEMG